MSYRNSSPAPGHSGAYGNASLNGGSHLMNTPKHETKQYGARALRSETRAKAKDDIKRVMNAIEKVRKWEKRWISVADSTLKLYKWVPAPVTQQNTEEEMIALTNVSNNNNENSEANKVNKQLFDESSNGIRYKNEKNKENNSNPIDTNKEKYTNNVLNHDENAQDVTSSKLLDNKSKSISQTNSNEDMITDNSMSQASVMSNSSLSTNTALHTIPTQQTNSNEQSTESENLLFFNEKIAQGNTYTKVDSNTLNDISAMSTENQGDTDDGEELLKK